MISNSEPLYLTSNSEPLYITSNSEPPRASVARSDQESDRRSAQPILLKNAHIYTGPGEDAFWGHILLDQGLIIAVGSPSSFQLGTVNGQMLTRLQPKIVEVNGHWVTAGIIDLFTRLTPGFNMSVSTAKEPTSSRDIAIPWDEYEAEVAKGITSMLAFPTGADGRTSGEGRMLKLRKAEDGLPAVMTVSSRSANLSKKHMKVNVGENGTYVPSELLAALRQATRLFRVSADNQSVPPPELKRDALLDALRCYILVIECGRVEDVELVIELSAALEFQIALLIYEGTTYWGAELIDKAYGKPLAIAVMEAHAYYFLQYNDRWSDPLPTDLAQRAYAEAGVRLLKPPVLPHGIGDPRFTARDALYGMTDHDYMMASLTIFPARIVGHDARIGRIREGYDADLVIWDSHPMLPPVRPLEVFIDGIPQLDSRLPRNLSQAVKYRQQLIWASRPELVLKNWTRELDDDMR